MDGNSEEKKLPEELDLSALASLSLEPTWASDKNAEKISVARAAHDDRRGHGPRRDRERSGGAPGGFRGRERRNPPPAPGKLPDGGDGFRGRERRAARARDGENAPTGRESAPPRRGRRPFGERRRDDARPARAPRVVDVSFFPEEKPFGVLAKAVKSSARTYELFEIARLILEKPERFAVLVKPLPPRKAPAGTPAEAPAPAAAQTFFVSVPDGMPFLNEADALAYVFEKHAEKFFSIETAEIEPPKGNFAMVAKCGFTGELLAPPNYHAYQQILRDHHAANFPKMPFEKFLAHVETVKDKEAVDAWLAKMKTVVRYTVKDRRDDEPETLDGAGAAKAFLLAHRKNKAVRAVANARFPGKLLEQMPMGPVKACIESELEFQRRFPLDTANVLRGRLRRSGFFLFKRGAKGVTFVCAVRRKFRTPDSVFSDSIQRVFDFLEKHPNTKLQDLPRLMLGIGEEAANAPEAAAEAPAEAAAETPQQPPAAERAEAAPAESEAKTPAVPAADEDAEARSLLATVRWLVLEGYVSELSDGSLFTHPKMSAAQAKAATKADEAEAAATEEKPDDIAAEIPPAPEAPEGVPEAAADTPPAVPAEEEVSSEKTENAPSAEPPSEESPSVPAAE